jgi:hypothetical protein
MKTLDKHYLSLQFQIRIFSKDGTEFQSFFEDILEKAFSDFQKIRPYGNKGDGGNDGYRETLGVYYQVYAPRTPKVNEKEAAEKFEDDFQKLNAKWDQISKIKEYNFVFNDKYGGSTQLLEEVKAKLKASNPNIEFKLFLAKDLESVFFQLSESDILGLGFNIDQRQSVSNAYKYLETINTEFDRENIAFVKKLLENIKGIISALGDENLSLEYEILESRCIQKSEKIDEARERYENIAKRHPHDARPFLYLAEICLAEVDLDGNKKFLEKAETIDGSFSLLKLQQILRRQYLEEKISAESIEENAFPDDPKIKANFYRLYGLLLENSGEQTKAESFIAKAIHLNPDRFSAYLDNISLIERRMLDSQDEAPRLQLSQSLLDEIGKVASRFAVYGDIGARNMVYLSTKKLNAFLVQENARELENVAKDIFNGVLACYFDKRIEHIVAGVFKLVSLPNNELNQLLAYLTNSKRKISDDLSEVLIYQFALRDALYTTGKSFFEETGNQKYLDFVHDLENENHERVLVFLENKIPFALALASTLRSSLALRRKIIENLPDDNNIQKDKLELLLNFDEKDFDEAFQILKRLDISSLSYFECTPLLHVARQKQAWDFEILLLEKFLEKEKGEKEIFILELQLLFAYLNLKKFQDVIELGEKLIDEDSNKRFLDSKNRDALITNTLIACLERGKVDVDIFKRARKLVEKFPLESPSLEFKAGIEAEIYLNCDEVEKALWTVIDGVKNKKILSAKEYARLYILFVNIGNRMDLNLDSLDKVQNNTFVKLSNKDQWYSIGNNNELDALPIAKSNEKYSSFIDKKLEDMVVFENKYSSEKNEGEIERIYTIEKYILWQVVQNFHKLAKDGDLEWAQMIEIPQKEDSIDPENLLKYLKDLNSRTEPFFDLYCKNNFPLAILAVSEGGLIPAIGSIQNENRGYIHFSVGTNDEREKQTKLAKKVINEKMRFYIDGTSALMLSEIGLLEKIHAHLPNMKVPQSVIAMFGEIANRFRYIPGQTGHTMGYARGKITLTTIEQDRRDLIQVNIRASVKLLEANRQNIGVISSASKMDCLSEARVPDELSDACILAQKENLPVLTEDHLYLDFNELETKKKSPEYFSSWALIRVLYDEGHLTFDDYLDYFGYLSSYRFRFLSFNPDDIEKAVFGDREPISVKPENIRKLNFPLTLSEEYGVSFRDAFRVVGIFLFRVLMNDITALDDTSKIFVEIINSFPTTMGKKELGYLLLRVFVKVFEGDKPIKFCKIEDKLKYQKVDKLLEIAESYNVEAKPIGQN